MSYSLMTPCFNCTKKVDCKDQQKLQDKINEIHQNPEDHKGSGSIMLMCVKVKPMYE